MATYFTDTKAREQFPKMLAQAEKKGGVIGITGQGHTAAYLLSEQNLMSLQETMEILADPKAMAAIRKARAGRGKYHPLSSLDKLG